MGNLGFTYIMASKRNSTLYIGVTNNLKRRIYEHKNNIIPGFTSKYNIHNLVYYEVFPDIKLAIHREKQLKKYYRHKKIQLIDSKNPQWKDLYDQV